MAGQPNITGFKVDRDGNMDTYRSAPSADQSRTASSR